MLEKFLNQALSENTIHQEITHFLCGSFTQYPALSLHLSFKDDLCLDSLDIVELMMHLEKKYGIEFEGEKLPKIENINDLAKCTYHLIKQNYACPTSLPA